MSVPLPSFFKRLVATSLPLAFSASPHPTLALLDCQRPHLGNPATPACPWAADRHWWHRKGDVFHLLMTVALVLDDRWVQWGLPPTVALFADPSLPWLLPSCCVRS